MNSNRGVFDSLSCGTLKLGGSKNIVVDPEGYGYYDISFVNNPLASNPSAMFTQKTATISKDGKIRVWADGNLSIGSDVYDHFIGGTLPSLTNQSCSLYVQRYTDAWRVTQTISLFNINSVGLDADGCSMVVVYQDTSALLTKVNIYRRGIPTVDFQLIQTISIPIVDVKVCDMSDNGDYIIFHAKSSRAIHVYTKNADEQWVLLRVIENTSADTSVTTFDISYDGTRCILGDPTFSSNLGRVWIYDSLTGVELYAETFNTNFGSSVAMNENGTLSAVAFLDTFNIRFGVIYESDQTPLSFTFTGISFSSYGGLSPRFNTPPSIGISRNGVRIYLSGILEEAGLYVFETHAYPYNVWYLHQFIGEGMGLKKAISHIVPAANGQLLLKQTDAVSLYDRNNIIPISYQRKIRISRSRKITGGTTITIEPHEEFIVYDHTSGVQSNVDLILPFDLYDGKVIKVYFMTAVSTDLEVYMLSSLSNIKIVPNRWTDGPISAGDIVSFEFVSAVDNWVFT
jgi:hypothetical protein